MLNSHVAPLAAQCEHTHHNQCDGKSLQDGCVMTMGHGKVTEVALEGFRENHTNKLSTRSTSYPAKCPLPASCHERLDNTPRTPCLET